MSAAAYRRAPSLVVYWHDGALILHNYGTGHVVQAGAGLLNVLDAFTEWRDLDGYVRDQPAPARQAARRLVRELHRQRFLWRQGESVPPVEAELSRWGSWNPSAGFFHTSTRNPRVFDIDTVIDDVRSRLAHERPPAPFTSIAGATYVPLPRDAIEDAGALAGVLRARRTWRQFRRGALPMPTLAALLQLTIGVQQWVTADGEGEVALKTSPSGGARHPIEAFLAVRRVSGLAPGFYHYNAGDHALACVAEGTPRFDVLLPTQSWYRDASVLVFFVAVFERTRWRYPGPRAYRAVLIEAGHLCQTFCLTATALGCAPFCSMAIADGRIERTLKLDGVSQSVLYAAGVGLRPRTAGQPGAIPRRRRSKGNHV